MDLHEIGLILYIIISIRHPRNNDICSVRNRGYKVGYMRCTHTSPGFLKLTVAIEIMNFFLLLQQCYEYIFLLTGFLFSDLSPLRGCFVHLMLSKQRYSGVRDRLTTARDGEKSRKEQYSAK